MGAQHQYRADFIIGAKLLGSFRGAMAAAQARLRHLRTTAMGVGRSIMKFGALFSTMFAGIAAFGVGSIFRKLFEGSAEAAAAAEQRERKLTAALMAQKGIRAKGREYAEAQTKELYQHTEEMSKQGVISQGMLNAAAGNLAMAKIGPREIAKTLPLLGDTLVAFKGINATQEDMNGLSKAFGKAYLQGVARPLSQFGIMLSKPEQKLLSQKAKAGDLAFTYKFLMDKIKLYSGESAKALKTPEGRIHALDNAMARFHVRLGKATLEARARMADLWLRVLPRIEPIIIKLVLGVTKAFESLASFIEGSVLPVFESLGTFWEQHPELQQGFVTLAKNIGLASIAVGAFALVAAVNPMLWVVAAAAAVFLLSQNWDLAARSASEYVKQQEAAGQGDTGLTKMVKLLDDFMTGLDLTGALIDYYLTEPLNRAAERLNKISDAWRKIPGLGWTAPAHIELQKPVAIPGAMERLRAKQIPAPKPMVEKEMLPDTVDVYRTAAKNVVMPMQDLTKHTEDLAAITQTSAPQVSNFVMQVSGVASAAPQATTELGYLLAALRRLSEITLPSFVMPSVAAPAGGVTPPMAAPPATVPGYASGGIVSKPTLATLAERGPEAVVPLGKGGFGGDTHVSFSPNITIHGGATEQAQTAMETKLRDLAREFVADFKRAQSHERRLSYEGGYG